MHWEECSGEWRKNLKEYCKSIYIYVTWISTGKALKSIWQMKVILLAIAYITSLLPSTHTPGKVKVGVESEREIEKGKFHFENKSVTVSGALMYQWNFSLLQYLLFSPCVTNNGSPPAALPFIKQEREHLDPLQLEWSEYEIYFSFFQLSFCRDRASYYTELIVSLPGSFHFYYTSAPTKRSSEAWYLSYSNIIDMSIQRRPSSSKIRRAARKCCWLGILSGDNYFKQ